LHPGWAVGRRSFALPDHGHAAHFARRGGKTGQGATKPLGKNGHGESPTILRDRRLSAGLNASTAAPPRQPTFAAGR